jgi:hypothetical protein
MKVSLAVLLACLVGCAEPGYRYNVHDNGEGSVSVERVKAADPAPAQAPPPMVHTVSDQEQIDALKAQVQQLSAENQKLKQPATAP